MRVALAAAGSLNYNPLPEHIISSLAVRYNHIPGVLPRLQSLPEIVKFKNVGKMPNRTPHENAVTFASLYKLHVYVGYLIYPDRNGDLVMDTHSFCVDNKRVVEPTSGIPWNSRVRYCGYRVPVFDHDQFKYLHKFNRLFV